LPAAMGVGAMTIPKDAIIKVYGFAAPENFKPAKIKFSTDGKTEMYYDVLTSSWDQDGSAAATIASSPVPTPTQTGNADTVSAPVNNSKSNGILEIVAFYAPEFVAFKTVDGKEIKNIEVYFTSDVKTVKASNVRFYNDKDVTHAVNFKSPFPSTANSSSDLSFDAKEIRFSVDGKKMSYNLEKSKWESDTETGENVPASDSESTSKPVRTFDQNVIHKSNGTLEIVAIYAPDFIILKPAKGKEFKAIAAYFVSGKTSYQASLIRGLAVSIDKDWKATYTDESEVRFSNFNTPIDYVPQKIRFVVDKKEMFFDVARSRWE